MGTIIQCDRCKGLGAKHYQIEGEKISEIQDPDETDAIIDLCTPCLGSYKDWFADE